jgi:DNA polymerase-4
VRFFPTPARDNGGVDEATILHVDMDSFFASCELARRPELRGKPVIVGGSGERSVVLTATYEARPYGVGSGMPMAKARRLAPMAIVIPPDQPLYRATSRQIMELLRCVTPLVEQVSVDEAFLDVTGSRLRLGSPRRIAERIRAEVRARHHITCSVGIAASKSVAKIASGMAKPDGVLEVPAASTVAFLQSLPVSKLWGVGGKTGEALAKLGIGTVKQLAETPVGALARALGPAMAQRLSDLAWGRDERPVTPAHEEKSIGAETTFEKDLAPGPELDQVLVGLADKSALRLREAGFAAKTIGIKVRTSDFRTQTRARTLPGATDLTAEIIAVARDLLRGVDLHGLPVRLIGVRLEHFAAGSGLAVQGGFGDDPEQLDQARAAQRASDSARARFGAQAVRPASAMGAGQVGTVGRPGGSASVADAGRSGGAVGGRFERGGAGQSVG